MYTLRMGKNGKILIPTAVREELGLKEKMLLNLKVHGSSIEICICTPHCQICGDIGDVQFTPVGALCESCISEIHQYYIAE
ncbi:MAG: AbrB/MazE/SpoVT family DNA-binding domain-containing protein [Oscillospiraceae bacterium]